jgi:hypothetical protein
MPGCGSLTKRGILQAMASKIDMGIHYDQINIAKPNTTPSERKVNTLLRLVNACFLEEFRDRVISSNNSKKRKDFEAASKRNPNEDLWADISEVFNDLTEKRIDFLCDSQNECEDEHLFDIVQRGLVNLNDFTQGTSKTCNTNLRNLMKARNNILEAKKISGTHQPDTWFYLNTKFLTVAKGLVMPDWPVYYLDVMCKKWPAIDAAYAARIKEALCSTSLEIPEDGDGDNKTPSKKDSYLKAMEQATQTMEEGQAEAKAQRAQLLTIKQRKEESSQWDEYIRLAKTLKEMVDAGESESNVLVYNLAVRVAILEARLKTKRSMVASLGIVVDEKDID